MTGKPRTIFFNLLILIASGCAGPVYQTPTPPILTPHIPEPAATSPRVATMTTASVVMPPDYSPILYGKKYDASTFFILLGGVQEGVWLSPEQAIARFDEAWEYDVYTLFHSNFQIRGSAPEFSPPNQSYRIGTEATVDEVGMIGVAQGWPVQQREVQELSPDQAVYQQAVVDWLLAQGLSAPQLDVLQMYRVDLEGDGVDEVLISATRLNETQHTTKSGDYSVVLVRKVVGNQAVTLPLVWDVYRSAAAEITFPRTYSLVNFLDLDQDGVLEIVVGFDRWEGAGALIYKVDGQNVVQLP